MRRLTVAGCAACGVLLACGGGQSAPEARTELGRSATDSAFTADSVKLASLLARDAADRQVALANRSQRSAVTYASPSDTPRTTDGAPLAPLESPEPSAPGVQLLTASEVAAYLRRTQGQVTVAILYGVHCPRSRAMFPSFVTLVERYRGQPVQVVAFALDRYHDEVIDFLARYQASFQPLSIRGGKVGELSAALASQGFFGGPGAVDPATGITIHMPFVAVLGRDGYARAQWHSATNIVAIDQAVQAELAR